jgi:vacuolar protein sorting-associated protein 52
VLSDIAQGRTTEKDPGLVSGLDSPETQTGTPLERLSYARIEGPGVTLAYMADDKTHVISRWLNVRRRTF